MPVATSGTVALADSVSLPTLTTAATVTMPRFKLNVFPANFSSEEILFHREDFPDVGVGDVVEIFQEDHSPRSPRLLLQVSSKSVFPPLEPNSSSQSKHLNKETVYIEKSIADSFKLQNFKDVIVRKVDKEKVTLDLVELTFREQYMGRSEMWRIKAVLVDTCVFINKKVDFCGGTIRCQVNEMWSQGEALACGVVTARTKVVFRSPTAMIYLFIQMSSEMWEFDAKGNLYYENAVNGFLNEMFSRWKSSGASHEMTIVLFSRCFYNARDKSEFPPEMFECLQMDRDGRFYEDFYRVVVQNERFDDWNPTLNDLRKIFTHYDENIVGYHKHLQELYPSMKIPEARISSAEQGNFLEVLNMSLNTFENHYLNRNMDRTGQQSIVLTPGVGVFEVDRELSQITKQRIIDSGVGSDLICVGEQPLHAVPLFKFPNRRKPGGKDDYSMPHWINLSFYSSNTKLGSTIFKPRIKLPAQIYSMDRKELEKGSPLILSPYPSKLGGENLMKYMDEYDEDVYNNNPRRKAYLTMLRQNVGTNQSDKRLQRKLSNPELGDKKDQTDYKSDNHDSPEQLGRSLKPGGEFLTAESIRKSPSITNKINNAASNNSTYSAGHNANIEKLDGNIVGSLDTPFDHQAIKRLLLRPGRALINPFDPSHTTVKLSSNRRRWTHIFPQSPAKKSASSSFDVHPESASIDHEGFSPIKTGVDWKSLTIPASFPITTDYFPEVKALKENFLITEYHFNVDEVIMDFTPRSLLHDTSLTMPQMFKELVSQRLAQGFQLIMLFKDEREREQEMLLKDSILDYHTCASKDNDIWLSIGTIFHKVSVNHAAQRVSVTIYRPRHPSQAITVEYRYRFQAPDNNSYEVSWVKFSPEKLENYNWNHLDYYVCTKGDRDFPLTENIKYWRLRMQLIPLLPFVTSTKDIMDSKLSGPDGPCDIYGYIDGAAPNAEGFLRFVDSCINKLRRKNPTESGTTSIHPAPNKLSNIAEAMRSPQHGLPFFVKTNGIPEDTFLSYDAVQWLIRSGFAADDDEAAGVLSEMLRSDIIRHASGKTGFSQVRCGYVFYTFLGKESNFFYGGDICSFLNDWVEVEFVKSTSRDHPFRCVFRELEAGGSSSCGDKDRPEWAELKYQSAHDPFNAFEISLEWTVATGALIADLAHTWARKAQQCNYSLIAVPRDPFALPITLNSDPVRGPIFVRMNPEFLTKIGAAFSQRKDTGQNTDFEMFEFREAIARRFGFIPCASNATDCRQLTDAQFSTQNQYIHCTGNMFLLIPTKLEVEKSGIQGLKKSQDALCPPAMSDASEPNVKQDPVLTRHLKDTDPVYDHSATGFLWSWNFMVSKRWKLISNTGATGDIEFMDKMLLDFRYFCSNKEGRLERFWKDYHKMELAEDENAE